MRWESAHEILTEGLTAHDDTKDGLEAGPVSCLENGMRLLLKVFVALVPIAFAIACSSTPDSNVTSAEGGTGGKCCPPGGLGCCMDYGGWSSTGQCGITSCDGMPSPGDPGWKIIKDDHGCDTWWNPVPYGGPNACGAPPFDSGADVKADVAKDAPADAPTDVHAD